MPCADAVNFMHLDLAKEWEALFTMYVAFSCFAVLNAAASDVWLRAK